jgi:putative ABC transport system permease protein
LRAQLTGDINFLFLILGIVALILGGVTIAVVSSLSIIERRGEIGLRRAIGATRGQIAAQFVTETSLVGLLGGLAGAAAGVLTVVAVAAVHHWTPVLDLRIVGAATGVGILLGAISGLVPAIRAARLEPAAALQQGVQ